MFNLWDTKSDQNPLALKIHPRSKSTRTKSTLSISRTTYRSRVRVRGNSDSEKNEKKKLIYKEKIKKCWTGSELGWILNAGGF